MDYLLKKYYISQAKTQNFLSTILSYQEIFGDNPFKNIQSTQFLDIQRKGNSQKELLKLANQISIEKYGIGINQNIVKPTSYVYLDDCLFSGITTFYDLEKWLNNTNIANTTIHLIFLACYSSGLNYYINQKLAAITKPKNISLKIWYSLKFENIERNQDKYECLWSKEIVNNNLVDSFVNIVRENAENKGWNPRLFRPENIPSQETLFSSPENRDIIEKAFLEKGAYICSLPKNRQPSMRPMGYEYLKSLGFGSLFITYRNIANNCPLVLWWGDPNYYSNHPFSKWYPLFYRKVNESNLSLNTNNTSNNF